MAAWAARISLSEIPSAALNVAKTCIGDGLGVMLAGACSPVFAQCAALPRPPGNCIVIDGSSSTDAATAALLNAVACHALDFDDTCYAGIVHGTATVLPAVLAVAQEVGASGEQLVEAFVAGVETVYALGLALTDSLYERGFWATATLGVVGAAAGAAKLLGLNAEGVAHAIRLAANVPVGLRATHGSSGKPYLCGVAAKLGVESAYAAKAGIQGQAGTFERRRGFAFTHNAGVLRREALDELGTSYRLLDPGIAFKLRPLCSATQAAIDATIALRSQEGFLAEDVESVTCRGTSLVVTSLPYHAPATPNEAQFSMNFAIACTLLHGDVRLDHLTSRTVADASLMHLMQRVQLHEDTTLVRPEAALMCPEAASVEIELRDGRRLQRTVMAATGMPQQPATEQQLQSKFMDCAMRVLGALEAGELWNRIRRIEEVSKARLLFDGLLPTGRT
ncbi:MmgE/PrpD family protein [plant metagenome]|uniref:MmgE/PrpD family protein n=1 Tax=plant metagenome TaxID=1297885 RepID=A0A484RC97_9ZZZZ